MAKAKEPTRAAVMEISRRLSAAYEAEDLSGMEPHELTAAVRELMILSRRAGIELSDDYHPVQSFLDTVAEWDEDHAQDLFSDIAAQEIADRRQLAEAEAAAARARFRDTAGEIIDRSGIAEDEFRSAAFRNLAANVPAGDTVEENVENIREMDRQVRATAKSIDHVDLRTEILSALPASQTPFGQIHHSQRRQAIQDHALATSNWDEDLETMEPILTHQETREAQDVARGEILAASQGPRALREFREQNGLDTSEYG